MQRINDRDAQDRDQVTAEAAKEAAPPVSLLIVQAAIEGHASTLYSEVMQHGQMLDSLRVVHPFS